MSALICSIFWLRRAIAKSIYSNRCDGQTSHYYPSAKFILLAVLKKMPRFLEVTKKRVRVYLFFVSVSLKIWSNLLGNKKKVVRTAGRAETLKSTIKIGRGRNWKKRVAFNLRHTGNSWQWRVMLGNSVQWWVTGG